MTGCIYCGDSKCPSNLKLLDSIYTTRLVIEAVIQRKAVSDAACYFRETLRIILFLTDMDNRCNNNILRFY